MALEASWPSTILRDAPFVYAAINALHILGMGTLFGALVTMDLRILGIWKRVGWRDSLRVSRPIAAAGLGVAIMTGFLLFAVRPSHYLANPSFLAKLGIIAVALINVAVFHRGLRRFTGPLPSLALRIGALLSMLLWILAIFAGRFIAFVAL